MSDGGEPRERKAVLLRLDPAVHDALARLAAVAHGCLTCTASRC